MRARRHYREYYPNATNNIIVKDNCRAGRLYVNCGETEFAILDLTVLPVFRRSGIATDLVRELQAEAPDQRRSLRVFVESFNPSQKLFSKLGFSITGSEGVNFRMEWNRRLKNLVS